MANIGPYRGGIIEQGPISWEDGIAISNKALGSNFLVTNFRTTLNKMIDATTEDYEVGPFSRLENIEKEEAGGHFISTKSSSEISRMELDILFKIETLFQSSQISEARYELQKAFFEGFNFPELNNWATILSRPTAKVDESTGGTDLRAVNNWLNENASKYQGQWVAFKNGKYISSDPSRVRLHNSLKEKGEIEETTFICLKH